VKAWVFVEGLSDQLGLEAFWKPWRERLRTKGQGIKIIPLKNKANFLKKFGQHAAEKLAASGDDLVIGMPDLHPIVSYAATAWAHSDAATLKNVQAKAVRAALTTTQGFHPKRADAAMARLYPSLFKYDFEMLLLAAEDALRKTLGTSERLGDWRVPVEDQNLDRPPKRVIEEIFRTKSTTRSTYRDTRDAPAVLGRVVDMPAMLRSPDGRPTCPEFIDMLRWLGARLGEPCCELPG